jgi:ribose transport system ATP-binding protein
MEGATLTLRSPEDAVRRGIAYVPAERSEEAAFMEMDVAENITMAHLDEVTQRQLISKKREQQIASKWVSRLKIKAPSLRTLMATLSGGNQQKVVFARWLLSPEIRLLLLDHPTRGLDVGAKSEVYDIMRDAAAADAAIVLISDSLEETIALSHNIIVMKDGRITERLSAPVDAKPSQIDILAHML